MSPHVPLPAPDRARCLASASELLRQGQACESRGELSPALVRYDEAIVALRGLPVDDAETRRLHGVAWMNRGNVLQKLSSAESVAAAIAAYDEAIAHFETLPLETHPAFRNHLGAAWLNRGHAQFAAASSAKAVDSFERAAVHFEQLPLGDDVSFRLNLAGVRTNLAHVLIATEPVRARAFAQSALALLDGHEHTHPAFAEMSLRARRALVMAIGEMLRQNGNPSALLAVATDAIDDGLALARDCIARGAVVLRPLALRLFRLGAQLYRVYQPHFLAEFVLENLSDTPFGADSEFRAAASEAISLALAETQKPQRLTIGDTAATHLLATAHSLRTAQHRFSALSSQL